jgi:hypothetical protein
MQGFLTKGHFVVVQEHGVCYWTSFRGFSPEEFQSEQLLYLAICICKETKQFLLDY